jgi:hypothetical protein
MSDLDQHPADWPSWATEPITVVAYDPAWLQWGTHERDHLRQLLAPWLTPTTSNMSARPPSPASPQEVDTRKFWLMITGPNFQWAVKVEPMMSTFARDFAAKVTGPETPPSLPAPAATCPRAAARRAERHGRAAEAGRAASRGDRDTAGVRGDEGAAALAPLRRLAGRHGPASEAHPLPILEGRAP